MNARLMRLCGAHFYLQRLGGPVIVMCVLAWLLLSLPGVARAAVEDIVFPAQVQQGAMVIGKVPPNSQVVYGERSLSVTDYGTVVFGVAADANGPLQLRVMPPGGAAVQVDITVQTRDWPTERVSGLPPKTVSPPPKLAKRIQAEQVRVAQARAHSDLGTGFAQAFIWPVRGRVSGRFGSRRVYNGVPGAGHSGMDIAVPQGTPVKAPAGGRVVFADPDLYLTGGTVLLDHGYGIGSNFLHLSRLDVRVGDVIRQGHVIGLAGATGRATGPHVHWGMTWFDVRIDPLLVVDRRP
ncbi:M23 family metallopeptidase [Castellaniella sp.]|uniref:M23 family metallopeptidase n=1 Tax=Castellaniella sp. TaxID=1955812 RepID=UPI002B003C35|nr:M23 family metallopeptidase [Castellaniella sp.]